MGEKRPSLAGTLIMKSIIKMVTHPHPLETLQARKDHAKVTNQPMFELPYWFENTETGQVYHDLYGCIGWPTEISERETEQSGYIAIMGVVRPNKSMAHYNPLYANFQLLAEGEAKDVGTLLTMAVEMREKHGFGLHPELLSAWFGDPERFITTLALKNEELIRQGGDKNAILITPPIDLSDPSVFDNYIRSLKSCLLRGKERLYFGKNEIVKNHLREFRKSNPAVMAVGGLVHSLLTHCSWMGETGENVFTVEEEESNA